MADDLERRLPDVPAAFPRPDAKLTDDVRRRVLALRPPHRLGRRLGLAAGAIVCVAASLGFTIGYWLRPASVDAATSISIAVRPGEAIACMQGASSGAATGETAFSVAAAASSSGTTSVSAGCAWAASP